MKRKYALIALLSTVIILLGIGGIILYSILQSPQTDDLNDTLHWLPDESYFVDYEIVDNTVKFRYSICFVNGTERDCGVKVSAKFKEEELSNWIKNVDFFEGHSKNGEWSYCEIKSGEKINLVLTFEGEYLGGSVNTDLSFPEELILATQTL